MRAAAAPKRHVGKPLYFPDGEIDRICLDALESAGCLPQTPAPIEIELFIEKHFGCLVMYDDLPQGVLGCAFFRPDGSVEAIGASRSLFDDGRAGERRVRTTLAHESGHGLLHASLFSDALSPVPLLDDSFDSERRRIMCREEDVGAGRGRYDGKWWEWQANQAIGGLLLPRRLVEACVEPLTRAPGSLGLRELPDLQRERAVRRVAAAFDVNPAVARIRLEAVFRRTEQRSL